MSEPKGVNYRTVLLELIGNLALADHIGDVSNDVLAALRKIGLQPDCECGALGHWLALLKEEEDP